MARQQIIKGSPPYLPIIVEDWVSDSDIQSMTVAQIGIFIKALIRQWQDGSLPRNPWDFAAKIEARYETVANFLQSYSNLFACLECGRRWTGSDCGCGCSKAVGRVENKKLKFLKIDVNSRLELGTTEQKRTEQN